MARGANVIAAGGARVSEQLSRHSLDKRGPMDIDELVVGTVCGSAGTSGIAGNPAAGRMLSGRWGTVYVRSSLLPYKSFEPISLT